MKHKRAIILAFSFAMASPVYAGNSVGYETVQARHFIGDSLMQGPYHRVDALASADGEMLTYTISSPTETYHVKGTAAAKTLIQEIEATEILKQRSTVNTMVGSAAGRTANIIKTPIRVVKEVGKKADNISTLEEGVLFVPELALNGAGHLINGAGELFVTGKRITTSATSTKCSGFNCVEKAGEDVWSGFNSLMGKHNAARRLHAEFGTDPQTMNKAYRAQIDRLSYVESYTATTVKIGGANAGIEYVSPAFEYVGFYNNSEFVAGYEDAHRRRNFEKDQYISWGADPTLVESIYKNKAITKYQRRELYNRLEAIPHIPTRLKFLRKIYDVDERIFATRQIAKSGYLASLVTQNRVKSFDDRSSEILFSDIKGRTALLAYTDYLLWTPDSQNLVKQAKSLGVDELRIIGSVSPHFSDEARRRGLNVTIVNQ